MTYLFIDTNIFLHFKFFEEMPWKEFTGGDFILMIAPIVLQELDKHKRHPNGKVASRAKKVLAKIEVINGAPESYPMRCIFERPQNHTLERYHLDRQEQDDLLLATILDFRHSYPDRASMLMTYDTGPLLKARSLGIAASKIDEAFLLPIEKSSEQKEIEKLTKELAAYKSATPRLKLTFEKEVQVLMAELDLIHETQEDFIKRRYQKEIVHLKLLEYEYTDGYLKRLDTYNQKYGHMTFEEKIKARIQPVFPIGKDQVDKYNGDLNDYYQQYRDYLEISYVCQKIYSLSLPINLVLHNYGTAPAREIDIWLHFPDGFMLINRDKLPGKPNTPTPPRHPTVLFDYAPSIPELGELQTEANQSSSTSLPADMFPGRANVRETNGYEVDNISYLSLKHHHLQTLPPLVVIFLHPGKIINFTIDYKITAANILEPIVGKLHVKAKAK